MKLLIVVLLIVAISSVEASRKNPKKKASPPDDLEKDEYASTSGSGGGKTGGGNSGSGGKGGKDGDGKGGKGGKDGGDGNNYDGGKGGKGGKDGGDGNNYDGGKGGKGGKDGGDGNNYDGGKGKGKGGKDGDDGDYGRGKDGDGNGSGHGNKHGKDGDDGDYGKGKGKGKDGDDGDGGHKKKKKHGDQNDKYKHKDHDFGKWCDEHDQPTTPPTSTSGSISTGEISPSPGITPPTVPPPCAVRGVCPVGTHCIVVSNAAKCVSTCYYNGEIFDHGMSFPAGDTCNNTCTCDDGKVDCTQDVCTDCLYYYADDEEKEFPFTFESGDKWTDECNACSCDNTVYMCEQKVCGGSCTDETGAEHAHDSEWPESDKCNTCECTDGEITCTDEYCPHCEYNGQIYLVGEGWQDGCNSCTCTYDEETQEEKSQCTDTCSCKTNDDCEDGFFCDIPSCDDTTGACYECTEENLCLVVPVCGCDGKNYDNSFDATDLGVIVRSYGQCPECSPDCNYSAGEVCCEGCFGAHNCVKLLAGQACPSMNCGYGYGY